MRTHLKYVYLGSANIGGKINKYICAMRDVEILHLDLVSTHLKIISNSVAIKDDSIASNTASSSKQNNYLKLCIGQQNANEINTSDSLDCEQVNFHLAPLQCLILRIDVIPPYYIERYHLDSV